MDQSETLFLFSAETNQRQSCSKVPQSSWSLSSTCAQELWVEIEIVKVIKLFKKSPQRILEDFVMIIIIYFYNRPFYRFGGHIELIRFKEYYGIPRATSSPGRFSQALEVGREKALASAGYMTTKHPEFVGVLN